MATYRYHHIQSGYSTPTSVDSDTPIDHSTNHTQEGQASSASGSDGASTSWSTLNRKLQGLETNIDIALVEYKKIGGGNDGKLEELLNEATSLLNTLNTTLPPNPPRHYTHLLSRHRTLLTDHTKQYHKLHDRFRIQREREALVRGVPNGGDNMMGKNGPAHTTAQSYYLTERTNVSTAHSTVDFLITNAAETREELYAQRRTTARNLGVMQSLNARFPILDNLVRKIGKRRRRDNVVLAIVTTICIVSLFIYATS